MTNPLFSYVPAHSSVTILHHVILTRTNVGRDKPWGRR